MLKIMADRMELLDNNFSGEDIFYVLKFPLKLWRIINSNETGAIWWGAFGKTIFINFQLFRVEYLECPVPKFKTKNLTSFVRQLNMYGFRKLRCHNRFSNIHEFYNAYFRFGRPDLLVNVKRKTIPLKMNGFRTVHLIENSQANFEDVLVKSRILRTFWKVPQANYEDLVIDPKYQIQLVPLQSVDINEEKSELTAIVNFSFIRLAHQNSHLDLDEPNETDWEDIHDDFNSSEFDVIPNTSQYIEVDESLMMANEFSNTSYQTIEDKEIFVHIPESDIQETDIYESLTKCFSSI